MDSSVIRLSLVLAAAVLIPACGGAGDGEGNSKSPTPPSGFITSPAAARSGSIVVSYKLADDPSDACSIAVSYSNDGGVTFHASTKTVTVDVRSKWFP